MAARSGMPLSVAFDILDARFLTHILGIQDAYRLRIIGKFDNIGSNSNPGQSE